MTFSQLLQSYSFDELMPVINEMFPGTSKFRNELQEAYDIAVAMHPVASKKSIRYKIIKVPGSDNQYMGAEDANFDTTWEVCLGKDVVKERGVDLSEAELVANCLVNLCLISRGPKSFESTRQILLKG